MRIASIVILVLLDVSLQVAAAPRRQSPPPMTYSVPSAAAPGKTIDITFFGPNLGDPIGLWTSFPAQVVPLNDEPKSVRFRLKVPAEAPIGIGAVRLLTSTGISSVQLFMIDDLPSIESTGKNHAPHDAQTLSGAVAVDGACEPLASEYFRIAAARGQKMSFEVVAQRLGSPMDPLIRLLDSAGRELVYCDDSAGIGADCRFRYTFPADGDYLLELRDVNYEGGPEYRYRLRVGDFPLIASVFPPGAKAGAQARFELLDSGGERLDAIALTLPSGTPRTFLSAKYPNGKGSGFAPVLCEKLEEFVAPKANHKEPDAARVETPVVIAGRLEKSGARDLYQLHAAKGERLTLTAQSRSLGSPCDLFIQVLKPDGQKIAQSAPAAADEPSLDVSIKDEGDYLVSVEDINHRSGPGMLYRLEIAPASHHFELTVDSGKIDATLGKTFKLSVKCVRHDYAGPISLLLAGDASGWELSQSTLAKAKTEAELEVKIPDDALTDKPLQFTIVGKVEIDGHEESHPVSTLPALKKLFPHLLYPPPELDGLIGLAVRAPAQKLNE